MRNTIGIAAITVVLLFCLAASVNAQVAELQITTNPHVQHVTDNAAIVQWSTNVPASALVRYGLVRYGMNLTNLNQVAEIAGNSQLHTVELHNLRSGTTYFYRVESSASGTRAITYVDQFSTTGTFVPYYTEPSSPSLQ
jgi:hypothetical protein